MCEDLAIEAERDTGHFVDMASLHRKHLDLLMCEEPMCLAILHMAFTVNCSHTLTLALLTRLENSFSCIASKKLPDYEELANS